MKEQGRVWCIGLSRIFRIKDNPAGGFTVQKMVPEASANSSQCDPTGEDDLSFYGVTSVWKAIALATTFREAFEGMIQIQAQTFAR